MELAQKEEFELLNSDKTVINPITNTVEIIERIQNFLILNSVFEVFLVLFFLGMHIYLMSL